MADLTKITSSDYENVGIHSKNNPLGLSVTEAKAAFDELSVDVIIPKINSNVDVTNNRFAVDESSITSNYNALNTKINVVQSEADTNAANIATNTSDITTNTVSLAALKLNVLEKNNITPFIPTADYNPATRKFVTDSVQNAGGGDMLSSVYDLNQKRTDIYAYADNATTGANILSKLAAAGSVLPIPNGGTGTTSLLNFLAFKGEIGSSGNANSYTENGIYRCIGGVSNLPSGSGSGYGLLIVQGKQSGYIMQMYRTGDHMWTRYSANAGSTWLDWLLLIDNTNLATQVQSLLTGGSISVIRQIIKGTMVMPNSTDNVSATVSLTNAAKAHVIIDGSGSAGGELAVEPYLVSLTNTTITLKNNISSTYTVSYQIVEYY